VLAAFAALVAIVCAGLLPFAPVSVNEPTVSWPRDPTRPESTLLTLTAYRPLGIDARFTCDAARAAQASGGLVLSTTLPESPLPVGLFVTARAERVQVGMVGEVLLDEPLPAGPCEYTITGLSTGRPVSVLAPTESGPTSRPGSGPAAGPEDAELVVRRDGGELARVTSDRLPDVDALATSVTALPGGGLSVTLRVDDEFTSSPAPAKVLLIVAVCAALAAVALLLATVDRTVARVPSRSRIAWPRVVDLVVPAVMTFWLFVAPATDDDGYYAAMSRNAQLVGEVGNYYQLYDQNFTPFTWFYQALAWWQQLTGVAPVIQRIPALAFGLLTWLLLRRFAAVALTERSPRQRAVGHAVLAVVFLAWWVPQSMGVRPESMVALCATGTMVAVASAARRRRLALAWVAFAVAGLGFTAHPTGFTLFAPLLAGLPLLWPLIRVEGSPLTTAGRALAVASGGMTAPLVAFADGALRDFLRGQAIFLSVQGQEGWTSEFLRYQLLLSEIAMGNYAKRATVLVCLVALVWFAVVTTAARLRGVTVPVPLWFAGSTTALAFAALWLTPSKWTHHFGALSGVGSVFLALLLVLSVPIAREILRETRVPIGVVMATAGSFVLALSLAWHGPNSWPYADLDGVWQPYEQPALLGVPLESPALWVGVLALCFAALTLGRRNGVDGRLNLLGAVPVMVVLSLATTTALTVGTFGSAAVRGVPQASTWAQGLADPTASRCGAAGVVRVLDPDGATPLPVAADLPASPVPGGVEKEGVVAEGVEAAGVVAEGVVAEGVVAEGVVPAEPVADGFVADGGYFGAQQPRTDAPVWGSFVARDGAGPDRTFGTMSTLWYRLPPDLPAGAGVTVLAAGTLSEGNTLTATYGRAVGSTAVEVDDEELVDPARSPVWRTLVLDPPAGADLVRLDAVDATGFVNGWLAFGAPTVQLPVPLTELIPAGAPVALGWQLAFNYPCLAQARVVDGITEAPAFGVLWGDSALSGLGDIAWQEQRGGVFGQVARSQSVQQLATVAPESPGVQVYVFGNELGRGAYTAGGTNRTVPGASTDTGGGP